MLRTRCFVTQMRSRWFLMALIGLAVTSSLALISRSWAQIPVNPDLQLIVYRGEEVVGHVYRDGAGPAYTEHWVLYPNYDFDRAQKPGEEIRIVAVEGGYKNADDFLANVPFTRGSRYVLTKCVEFDELPSVD